MTPAVERTDFGERRFGENPCKIHCDLPRISNAAFAPTGFHLGRTYRIKIADNAADKFRRYGALLAAGNVILKDAFGKGSGDGLVDEFCIGKHAGSDCLQGRGCWNKPVPQQGRELHR